MDEILEIQKCFYLQAERDLRQKLKAAFKGFIDKVEGLTHGQVEFDIPYRELGYVVVLSHSFF